MRPLWKGTISFGLVNIPVGLYSAIRRQARVELELLRDSDLSRIHYKKVAEADGQEVPKEHILKGYEYENDKYVPLTGDDFRRVEIKSTQTVDIQEFVKLEDIDPRFFDQPFFLAPEKAGAKAYVLLRTALEQTGLVGISKVVIRPPREHLAAVKPLAGVLLLETMHFADELRETAEVEVPHTSLGEKELSMAVTLVNSMTGNWQPDKYHDEYRDCLMKMIEEKIHAGHKKLPAAKRGPQTSPGKVIDLAELLQRSLGEKVHKKPAHKRLHRKAA
ncbi:MAG TPA: Ku protein [Verrucomicrobiae bacterium]|nr:Ku protein [Verrucomicrobiae bacterium]